ncbi:hypothetical protein ACQ858_13410 [Variovorax ureilyticus]|uniref:hypothetical protein n=1 Tax=Variovorax ureilyticus TaxID=1836198 RepID=UPI003D67DA5C
MLRDSRRTITGREVHLQLVLVHPDVSPKQLKRGLSAAIKVFEYEDVDAYKSLQSLAREAAWHDSGGDQRYALSAADVRALDVLTCAQAAANGVLGTAAGGEMALLDFEE